MKQGSGATALLIVRLTLGKPSRRLRFDGSEFSPPNRSQAKLGVMVHDLKRITHLSRLALVCNIP
jgi:hypothetical protein